MGFKVGVPGDAQVWIKKCILNLFHVRIIYEAKNALDARKEYAIDDEGNRREKTARTPPMSW